MPQTHDTVSTPALSDDLVDLLLEEHLSDRVPRLRKLWDYFRNPPQNDRESPRSPRTRLAQERGLPARFTALGTDSARSSREVVIENDIGWRIHALVDFMFSEPVKVQSCAPDADRARQIEGLLQSVINAAGGVSFYQDLALLGAVYGYADVVVREPERSFSRPLDPSQAGEHIRLELIEAPRAVPVLDPGDYRKVVAFIVHYPQQLNEVQTQSFASRLRNSVWGGSINTRRRVIERTLIWTPGSFESTIGPVHHRLPDTQEVNRLGRIPVVHIQNLPQPFHYEGLSEVEPLLPLQDELNIRLSDRANRVTFQSFKMYLGKGIEKFTDHPVGPGQMWASDNPDATIEEFGGDAASPSEDAHIAEIREALDKTSGVSPVAAGVIRDKVGNLTSENALRIVLMGLLARTAKKRVTYGAGIERICELVLHAADVTGLFPNTPDERRVRLDWPPSIPDDPSQKLKDAQIKLELGVPRERVLTELGYADCLKDLPIA
ncbi:MAG: phage portal protein [Phycisphaera sp.]|nr:phage portal protein [Phycisphaera sp.]